MRCDSGLLKAYADADLAPAEHGIVTAHLASCAACQGELSTLRARASAVATHLAALGPGLGEAPAARQALAHFRRQATDAAAARPPIAAGPWAILRRSLTMIKESFPFVTGRLRPLAVGAAAIACLLILFSFAPVRQVAADFLGIFRVRKFAVIPLDVAQQQKLESLAKQGEEGRFGKPISVREPGKPMPVADLAEASKSVGFSVRAPATLPAGALRKSLTVQSGPALHYEMDRAVMQALLDATQAQGVKLPAVDKVTIDVDVPFAAAQEYAIGNGRLALVQMTSPQVDIPPGIDLAVIGEAGFKFLGMPDADARRLAQSIDWTNTLVIPMPANVVQYREVTVDGVPGLLIEHRPGQTNRRAASLLWQKNGILYGIETTDVDPLVAMQVADSLR